MMILKAVPGVCLLGLKSLGQNKLTGSLQARHQIKEQASRLVTAGRAVLRCLAGERGQMLSQAPPCRAHTVDISADGSNNAGIAPARVYRDGVLGDARVNALIVVGMQERSDPPASQEDAALVAWFTAEVLRGADAFAIQADGYDDYARAMTLKLEREVQAPLMSKAVVPQAQSGPTGHPSPI